MPEGTHASIAKYGAPVTVADLSDSLVLHPAALAFNETAPGASIDGQVSAPSRHGLMGVSSSGIGNGSGSQRGSVSGAAKGPTPGEINALSSNSEPLGSTTVIASSILLSTARPPPTTSSRSENVYVHKSPPANIANNATITISQMQPISAVPTSQMDSSQRSRLPRPVSTRSRTASNNAAPVKPPTLLGTYNVTESILEGHGGMQVSRLGGLDKRSPLPEIAKSPPITASAAEREAVRQGSDTEDKGIQSIPSVHGGSFTDSASNVARAAAPVSINMQTTDEAPGSSNKNSENTVLMRPKQQGSFNSSATPRQRRVTYTLGLLSPSSKQRLLLATPSATSTPNRKAGGLGGRGNVGYTGSTPKTGPMSVQDAAITAADVEALLGEAGDRDLAPIVNNPKASFRVLSKLLGKE